MKESSVDDVASALSLKAVYLQRINQTTRLLVATRRVVLTAASTPADQPVSTDRQDPPVTFTFKYEDIACNDAADSN